jgi:hypothetical protein
VKTTVPRVVASEPLQETAGTLEAQIVLKALHHWLEKHERELVDGVGHAPGELLIFRALLERAE